MKTMEWDSKKGRFVEKESKDNGDGCGSCSAAEDLSEMESKVRNDNRKMLESVMSYYQPKQKKVKKTIWQLIKDLF